MVVFEGMEEFSPTEDEIDSLLELQKAHEPSKMMNELNRFSEEKDIQIREVFVNMLRGKTIRLAVEGGNRMQTYPFEEFFPQLNDEHKKFMLKLIL